MPELVSERVKVEGFLPNGKAIEGIQAYHVAIKQFQSSFFTLDFTIDFLNPTAKCVICMWSAKGVQIDSLWGMIPHKEPNQEKKMQGLIVSSIENEKIVSQWFFWSASSSLIANLV